MNKPTLFKWKSIISIAITTITGLIFLTSGIAKIFVLKSFSVTVAHFLPFLISQAYIIAVFVVLAEIILGTTLLLRIKISYSSFAAATLLTFFIGILMYESMTGNSIRCNCFGGLNISFPSKIQIIIDLILLNGLIAVNFLHAKLLINSVKKNWISWAVPAMILLLLELTLVKSVWAPNKTSKLKNSAELISFVSNSNIIKDENAYSKKVYFFISFSDFNCPLCYDDFLALSDSLQLRKRKNIDIVYVFEKEALTVESLDSLRLEAWKEINNINSPVLLTDVSLFEQCEINKSSIFVFDENNQIVARGQFPVGDAKRASILNYLVD